MQTLEINATQPWLILRMFTDYTAGKVRTLCASPDELRAWQSASHGEVRWKHAMHLLCLLLTGAATLRDARVPVRLEAHHERLLAVKRGEMPLAEVDAWRKELHRDFERALTETNCPNALTTKRRIASSSKHDEKWRTTNEHQ